MKSLKEFIVESKSQELLDANIGNIEVLYSKAIKANNAQELKDYMLKMKSKFKDAKDIKFDKVDWEEAFNTINEASKSDAKDSVSDLRKDIEDAFKRLDAKYLKSMTKEITDLLSDIKSNKFKVLREDNKEEYDKLFATKLEAYEVESIDDLSDEDKEKFYEELEQEWESTNKEKE